MPLIDKSIESIQKKHSLGLFYALPMVGMAFLMGPLAVLQGIYAKYFGLSLTSIAWALLISRLFDAVTDPMIGYLSDKHRLHSGTRKPLIVVGGVLFGVSSYFLFSPSPGVTPEYFLIWILLFYLGHTLFDIPHLSWANDVCISSCEKNIFYGWRSLCLFIGMFLFYTIPFLPIFGTNNFTPHTLRWAAIVAVCCLPVMLYISLINVPKGRCYAAKKQKNSTVKTKKTLSDKASFLLTSRPLLLFMAAFCLSGIGVGMWVSLIFLFVDAFLGLGEGFASLYLVALGGSILSLGIWYRLVSSIGKQLTWSVATFILFLGVMTTGLIEQEGANIFHVFPCITLVYIGFSAWNFIASSLLGDVVDYGTLKYGCDHSGVYFSIYTVCSKASVAIGSAIGLWTAEWYGFDATATTIQGEAAFGMRLAIAWLPAPLILFSLFFIGLIPITARRHSIIRRRIDSRIKPDLLG